MTTTKLTLKDLRDAAAKLGATVEDHSGYRVAEYQIAAPDGKVWATTGDIHWIVLNWNGTPGRPEWPEEKQAALADAIERIGHGLADCEIPDCDVCHPDEETDQP